MSWILEQQELHITIGSIPQIRAGGKAPDLKNDIQMIKASILYADHAKLCSLSSSSVLSLLALTDIPENNRLDFLREMRAWPMLDQAGRDNIDAIVEAYEFANRRRHSKRGESLLRQFHELLGENWLLAKETMLGIVSDVGGDGIVQAVGSGLLEVHTFGSVRNQLMEGAIDSDAVLEEFVKVMSAAVSDAQTYPLFDERASKLISSGIAAGIIPVSDSGIVRGKEVALAADLLARLPLFPQASVKEVLDIRRELEKPLRRFRAAMITFSEKIKDAAWDKDFPADAEQVFKRDVAPAILDLEEEVGSNRYLSTLLAGLAEKPLQIGGAVAGSAALPALAVRMFNSPIADIAALATGPMLVVGGIAYNAYRKWKSQQSDIEQNSLFFYHKAATLLSEGRYEYVKGQS